VDKPKFSEVLSTCIIVRAGVLAAQLEEVIDHLYHSGLVRACHIRADTVVGVLEASDVALFCANFLQVVKADFHFLRHLVVEAEVMVGLNERERVLAFL